MEWVSVRRPGCWGRLDKQCTTFFCCLYLLLPDEEPQQISCSKSNSTAKYFYANPVHANPQTLGYSAPKLPNSSDLYLQFLQQQLAAQLPALSFSKAGPSQGVFWSVSSVCTGRASTGTAQPWLPTEVTKYIQLSLALVSAPSCLSTVIVFCNVQIETLAKC